MARPFDTSPEAFETMKILWLSLTPQERFQKSLHCLVMGRYLILARLHFLHPNATPRETMIMLFEELYSGELPRNVIDDVVQKIRSMPFRPEWRKILGIDENTPVD